MFQMDLVVVKKKCKMRIKGLRRFKLWTVYVDAIALLLPMLTYVTDEWKYQLMCSLRLRLLYDFHYYFCKSFKVRFQSCYLWVCYFGGCGFFWCLFFVFFCQSKLAPVLMKFLIVLLMVHAMTCGWIYTACRGNYLSTISFYVDPT